MWIAFVQAFFAVFGVMDPVGNVPMFITLTGKLDAAERERLAAAAVLRAGVVLLIFTLFGSALLEAFHVSLESFRIAGGVILALIGLQIVFGHDAHAVPVAEGQDISIVPLAMPLIAGPGMITTAVILAREYGYVLTLAAIAANLALTRVLFRHSGLVLRLLGAKGSLAFAKVMGLILVSIGVELIRSAW